MTQTAQSFQSTITQRVHLDYLLYLPPDYDALPAQHFPLILFLHSAGARGSDLEKVKSSGIARKLANGEDLPFIVLSPQCPEESHWTLHVDALNALLDHIITQYRVDENAST